MLTKKDKRLGGFSFPCKNNYIFKVFSHLTKMGKGLGVILMIIGLISIVYNFMSTPVFFSDFELNSDFNILSIGGLGISLLIIGLLIFLLSKPKSRSL